MVYKNTISASAKVKNRKGKETRGRKGLMPDCDATHLNFLTAGLDRTRYTRRQWRWLCSCESVSQKTFGQYLSHVRRVKKAGYPTTFEGLGDYLSSPESLRIAPVTVRRMRSAFGWFVSARGDNVDRGMVAQVDVLTQRHKRCYVGHYKDTAAITWAQLHQILEMLANDPVKNPNLRAAKLVGDVDSRGNAMIHPNAGRRARVVSARRLWSTRQQYAREKLHRRSGTKRWKPSTQPKAAAASNGGKKRK